MILFSHGLGRNMHSCAYFGRHWAAAGFVVAFPEHFGSDDALRRGIRQIKNLRDGFQNSRNLYNRVADIRFVIDQLEAMHRQAAEGTRSDSLSKMVDPSRVAVAGNDFGAETSLVLVGETGRQYGDLSDPRIDAAIALSPPVRTGWDQTAIYGNVHVPCLHITGTRDNGIIGTTRAYQRRIPFDHIQGADNYLVTLRGADHLVYTGEQNRFRNNMLPDSVYQEELKRYTTAFLRAYLGENRALRDSLRKGGMQSLGSLAKVEMKLAPEKRVTTSNTARTKATPVGSGASSGIHWLAPSWIADRERHGSLGLESATEGTLDAMHKNQNEELATKLRPTAGRDTAFLQ